MSRLPKNPTDPEEIIAFFEGMNFDLETKNLGSALLSRLNLLLHRYTMECKKNGVTKEACFNSQKLALATCLKMRIAD